ncbi:uracil-DNA glycosylase [Oceanimonas sp. GK1]|uniref:uracil-DNA glycosylase family protein n=1 Tax=Oceanimonas sp. (strain GK1 / IBRC-M 10197) TaxID=511062 RepID=UPI0002494F4A|nr:uracil-DNA glycosylase family protein [Oceanimonas sp. GK1]AEY00779.1 uracil-DNA glycosylase [Oceanimonas sp. GK1]
MKQLLAEVRACRLCEAELPLGPRPVVQLGKGARILIIGQAPGTRVHDTGIPWNDPSGDTLRRWLELDRDTFYNPEQVAIMPMGFCYPGPGKSGDLPPRPECAPTWHARILAALPDIRLTLLIGQYAQRYYLGSRYRTLTETVRHWREFAPERLPLPHPSPRNRRWLTQNPWFEQEELPALKARVHEVLNTKPEAGS